jgi:hypothetical protein
LKPPNPITSDEIIIQVSLSLSHTLTFSSLRFHPPFVLVLPSSSSSSSFFFAQPFARVEFTARAQFVRSLSLSVADFVQFPFPLISSDHNRRSSPFKLRNSTPDFSPAIAAASPHRFVLGFLLCSPIGFESIRFHILT